MGRNPAIRGIVLKLKHNRGELVWYIEDEMRTPQRWLLSFPFIVALASIVFWGWSALLLTVYPYGGFPNVSPNGLIPSVDRNGPASQFLRAGDEIKTLDDRPLQLALPRFGKRQAGEAIQLQVSRDGQIFTFDLELIEPPGYEITRRLVPLLVALVFWLVSVGVLTFRAPKGTANLFFLFCQTFAILLIAGAISTFGPPWASNVFNLSVWLIGPVMVHFHLWFPQSGASGFRRKIMWLLYGIGFLGAAPYLIWDRVSLGTSAYFPTLRLAALLYLTINFLIVIGLLYFAYRKTASAQARGKIRIVLLGTGVVLLPILTLSVLPEALFQRPIVPFEFAFLLLSVIPLTYGYAIVRHRLIEIEKHVNRGATQVLVFSLIGSIYLILSALFNQLLSTDLQQSPITMAVVVIVLASLFQPLRQRVQIVVDKAFYGGWYDFRTAISKITQGLEQITDLRLLASAICERISRTLLLDNIHLFLTGPKGDLSIYETFGLEENAYHQAVAFPILPNNSRLLQYLQELGGAIDTTSVKLAMAHEDLSEEEHAMLGFESVRLLVPIFGRKQISGVLALGPKVGGDVYSVDDLYVLGVVARQVGPLIENIHLLTQLRQYARNLEKRVEERTAELHDAKERVEAILASVGDGVIVTDLAGNIITVNSAFERQSGFCQDELAGRELYSLVSERNEPEIVNDLQLTLGNGEVWIGELIGQRKNGAQYDIQLTIAPVRDQSGQMVGFVGSQRDITHQKELDRLKDQFASDVSHELRTPVTNLSLYIGLLERAKASDKRAEYMAILREETRRLTELLEDILDLSRLEAEQSEGVLFMPVDVNAVVERVIGAHQMLARTSGLEIIFEPGERLPPISGIESLFSRVMTNLISNAIRYTSAGHISVRTYQVDGQVCVDICDTGMGIEDEDLPHLFDRFYRGRKVSQSKIPGTGLGLAIVKEIMDLHHGKVEVRTEKGQGSTFSLQLPVQELILWPEKLSSS